MSRIILKLRLEIRVLNYNNLYFIFRIKYIFFCNNLFFFIYNIIAIDSQNPLILLRVITTNKFTIKVLNEIKKKKIKIFS